LELRPEENESKPSLQMPVEPRGWRGTLARNSKKEIQNQRGIAHLRHNPTNSPVWNDLIKVKDLY
jgi:hypothetical protein